MAFEVGNVVKIMISNQPWRGVIVTYTNDNPPIYEVRVDDLKQIFTAKEDELSLLSEGSGGGGGSTGDGVLIVNVDTENWVLNKTWQEITDAPFAIIKDSYDHDGGISSIIVVDTWIDDERTENAYQVTALRSLRGANPETLLYFCDGANEYPIID